MGSYLSRELSPLLHRALESMPVVVLTGMRQVGKTTLLKNDPELSQFRYFTMDDPATRQAARGAPQALLESAQGPQIIDEVQKEPALLEAIKVAVDQDRRPGRFLLSGSANLLLMSRVTESLAGRALYLTLHPMTRRELAGTKTAPFVVSILNGGEVPGTWGGTPVSVSEVLRGGMPSVAVDHATPDLWFQGFEQTYLERDIRALSQVADLAQFQTFLRLASLRTGKLLNVSDLARDAALPASTATRYLGLLETSFSAMKLPPYLANPSKRLVKSPKLYLADSGLAAHLQGVPANASLPLSATQGYGALLETYVATHLVSMLQARLPQARLFFWNQQGRHEVDFILENGSRTLAVELKSGSRWRPEDLGPLKKFLAETPGCVAGLLACDIAAPLPLGPRLWAVPTGLLLS